MNMKNSKYAFQRQKLFLQIDGKQLKFIWNFPNVLRFTSIKINKRDWINGMRSMFFVFINMQTYEGFF